MPLFEYECPVGHRSEELRPAGTDTTTCPCGEQAHRVPSRFAFTNTPTGSGIAQRNSYSLYREASQELDYSHRKAEADLERPLPTPDLWGQAKKRAQAMVTAGEAPPPQPHG